MGRGRQCLFLFELSEEGSGKQCVLSLKQYTYGTASLEGFSLHLMFSLKCTT
jgi:hypothetical protein